MQNTYHWDYENYLDGILVQPKPDETDSIPAELPGVVLDADEAYGTATFQEVANENTVASGVSANAGILHGNPHTGSMEVTALPLLVDNDNNIKELDMIENEPKWIFNVDADNATDGYQEDPTDDNPGDNRSQKQYGVSDKADDTDATDSKDMTNYREARDNPECSIKVENVEN